MKTGVSCAIALVLLLPAIAAAEEPSIAREPGSKSSSARNVDLIDLIERVAKKTGKQFVVDPRVRAEVPLTGFDVDRLDYDKLLAILNVNQFAVYSSAGLLIVAPDANSRQFPTAVTTDIPAKALDNEMVTLIVQVKRACAPHMVPVLRPLMPQSAHLAAMPPNLLLLVDRAANARRIVDMVERLDKAAPAGEQCPPILPYAPPAPRADAK